MREALRKWRFGRALRTCAARGDALLAQYAQADWPDAGTPIGDASLLALDFELDGLASDAHVLQAGWLAFDARGIDLGTARSCDVKSARRLDDEAVAVHGIGEQRARAGDSLGSIVDELVGALAGRIMVAHGASIEREVIARVTRARFGLALPVRSICTLALERRLAPNLVGSGPYRLAATRARYGLPAYHQHDALSDALAAGELLLAQLSRMSRDTRLGRLEAL